MCDGPFNRAEYDRVVAHSTRRPPGSSTAEGKRPVPAGQPRQNFLDMYQEVRDRLNNGPWERREGDKVVSIDVSLQLILLMAWIK